MGFVQRRLVKMVMGVVAWPKVTLTVCCVLLVAAVLGAWSSLSLSTDENALLTPDLKFFKDYLTFDRKFPENEAFVVLVEPRDYGHLPETPRWRALAEEVKAKLMELKGDVQRVDTHVTPEELGDQGLLFEEWQGVKEESAQMLRMLPLLKIVGEKPGLDSLLLGSNLTERFYRAMGQGPAAEGRDFAMLVTRSLDAALDRGQPSNTKPTAPDLRELGPDAKNDPTVYGYFMIPDETKRKDPVHKHDKIMVINVYDDRDYTSLADVTEPLTRMRAAVAGVAARYPEFMVGMTGRPALEADEMRTSDHDTKLAEICGLSLVFVMLLIFLRNLWLVIVAEICLGVGIGWTFGWATWSVGRLNLLSLVFVIALIGIGMDYLIQILTRYRYEKRRYRRAQAIWTRVFRYVSPPVSTACLGAAGAFFVSSLTNFKGAAELGLIAGGGLLLCLAAGYTLLPALLTVFPAEVGKVAEARRYRDPAPAGGRGWLLALPLIWVVAAGVGLWFAGTPTFDPNLLRLQAAGLESVRLVHKLPTWSAAVMAQDLAELRQARTALTPKPGQETRILKTESILDAVDKQVWMAQHNAALRDVKWAEPGGVSADDMQRIAAAAEGMMAQWKNVAGADLSELRAKVADLSGKLRAAREDAALRARVEAWQKAFWRALMANARQFVPGPLEVARLPAQVRAHLVSEGEGGDGKAGPSTYALYVYPKDDLWEEGRLGSFVEELEQRQSAAKLDEPVTGIAVELLYSTREIHRAFLLSTGYAIALIFLLVLLDLRRLGQTVLAISVLVLGLPMLVVLMACWRWMGDPLGIPGTWNFANFFALPILIGAGHEYGVFMVHRYRETLHDPRRVWLWWDVSDRALLLCALVTSSSFGFLMMAQHRGLASLGWVMAVGSGCIYLSTVLVLRPILQWRLRVKGVQGTPDRK